MTALPQVEKESVKPLASREMDSLQRRTAAEQTLGSRLADCLAATPLAPAIGMGGVGMSEQGMSEHGTGEAGPDAWLNYGELSLRVAQIAARLQGLAVGERVGLYLERGPDLVASLLACLRLGLTFVPLEPDFPVERLQGIARQARLSAVICDVHGDVPVFGCPLRSIPALDQEGEQPPAVVSWPNVDDALAAYMMFTSGSTGEPKGVVISRRALLCFLDGIRERLGISPRCHWLFITTPAFDISLLEMLGPLWGGGRLTVAGGEHNKDPLGMMVLLEADPSINFLQATPACWRMLLKAGWQGRERLTALCGGEALDSGLAEQLCSRTQRLWNCYGPTEATVWSLVSEVCWPPAEGQITISHSLPGYRHWVLDEAGLPVSEGECGELCIESPALCEGYWRKPALTSAAFLRVDTHRLYRTGDRVRRLGADRFLYLGRRDDQVKLRGFRIELGEVEAGLRRQPGVQEAAVRLVGEGDEAMLVGYVEAKAGVTLNRLALRKGLQATLPHYMVPARILLLDALPKTGSGKLDRKALPLPE
ncbi:amonabactin biosynthesis glycine adenylation protein AmoH [Aeromonas salmonicida]|uniref:amonabactin biosynthesis glycine adenylation protein AmoH n=1 Tax=Aeromonas salmonicida TaxID=645 RepID=UPI00073C0DB7|nr:amonabactin biosynthesis glycine adenylation protein AmoH [Aeromonas salmonicida]KTA86006.1 peptide synthetase [Aeromonas salmonicida]